jgi:hypothetical protein
MDPPTHHNSIQAIHGWIYEDAALNPICTSFPESF